MVKRWKNINPNDNVHCCITGCLGNSLLHLVWTKKSVVKDFWGGIKSILQHLYLNVYFEVDSKISYIMFLHDYQWGTNNNPVDGPMGSSGRWRVRKLSGVRLHNNAIVVRGILVTILHCGTRKPRLSAIHIVSSVGT